MKLYAPKEIRAIQEKYKFRNRRSLGQNFLTDKNIIDKIIGVANVGSEDLVVEIGPGMGVLTDALAERAGYVIAIELDRKLIPILTEVLAAHDNVEVIQGDVLKIPLRRIIENAMKERLSLKRVHVIGNLPYYITTPILMKLLEEEVPVSHIIVMMQKEVAQRIEASPGNKKYGALSIAVQYRCLVEGVVSVSKESFFPPPKVDSTVLKLGLRKEKAVKVCDEKTFFACVKAGFGQRRKTLLNSLTGVNGLEKEKIAKVLSASGIDHVRRAETLSMEEFGHIADEISVAKKEYTDI